jgi:predicted PurR-regulated permease PerM
MKGFALVVALLGSGGVLAADLPGSRDLDSLPRFPASTIVAYKESPSLERIYPQGSIRRISGRLRYEREILAQGRHAAVTYELPRTHSADQVFTSARESLLAQGAELLYWCQGRECGASSLWANSVFGNATLYGSDDQQAYALLRLAEPNHDSLLALYSITRGNRRAYLHAEQLDAEAPLGELLPTPATLLRQLAQRRPAAIAGCSPGGQRLGRGAGAQPQPRQHAARQPLRQPGAGLARGADCPARARGASGTRRGCRRSPGGASIALSCAAQPGTSRAPSRGALSLQRREFRVMATNDRLLVQILLLGLLAASLWVLAPFWSALFWAAVLAFASWPLMRLLTQALQGRLSLAAGILTCGWVILVAVPLIWLGFNLADHIKDANALIKDLQVEGLPPPPSWLVGLPLVGERLATLWLTIDQQGAAFFSTLRPYLGQVGNWLLARSAQLGGGMLELGLSLVLVFFFYRDGPRLAVFVHSLLERLIGERADHYLELVAGTVQRVVNGVIGTAAAQGLLALIGFWIAGVPGALVLGILTFFLSLVPMGPPLVWIPVTAWLVWQGEYGFALFLGAWGMFVISGVDNILKPYLISRGGNLPLVVVLLGVFGGILAFGFMGLFLGPTLLAVAYSLLSDWVAEKAPDNQAALDQLPPDKQA